jgi:hypothetical protein
MILVVKGGTHMFQDSGRILEHFGSLVSDLIIGELSLRLSESRSKIVQIALLLPAPAIAARHPSHNRGAAGLSGGAHAFAPFTFSLRL